MAFTDNTTENPHGLLRQITMKHAPEADIVSVKRIPEGYAIRIGMSHHPRDTNDVTIARERVEKVLQEMGFNAKAHIASRHHGLGVVVYGTADDVLKVFSAYEKALG